MPKLSIEQSRRKPPKSAPFKEPHENHVHIEDQAIYPGAELFLIQQFMLSQGFSDQQWLLGTGLSDTQLTDHNLKDSQLLVSLHQFDVIYRNISRLVNTPDVGLNLGMALNLSRWGVLACALQSSKTLGHALLTANQYRSLLRSRFLLSGQLTDGIYQINVDKQQGMEFPAGSCFSHEILLGSLHKQISELLNADFNFEKIHLNYPAPKHALLYERLLGCPVEFDKPRSQMFINEHIIMNPLPMANPISKRQALNVCELEIQRVMHTQQGNTAWQVRSEIAQKQDGHIKLEAIAQYLHMSPRTLRRKLQDNNTSFLVLRQEFQLQQAMDFLIKKELPISQIAGLCGYKDLGSFRDGFKKLSGQTPQQYRSSL